MTTEYSFIRWDLQAKKIICQGEWNLAHLHRIKKQLKKMPWPTSGQVTVHGKDVTAMDSAGAWVLQSLLNQLTAQHQTPQLADFSLNQKKILSLVHQQTAAMNAPLKPIESLHGLAQLGKNTISQLKDALAFLRFTGQLTIEALRLLPRPRHFRWRQVIGIMEKTGVGALPLIAILSLMIGIVIAYQMGEQLRKYGANLFIVDLLGFSVLREFGPLLTAILVAGRTGSAFAAELGIMKINQEMDALNTMGITSAELLLLPRMLALFLVMPLLTIWSDIFGIIGGMIMANNLLDVTWVEFLRRFQQEIPARSLIIGLCKAPVFALLIASIGCFEGMEVSGSSNSIGARTTRSVVFAIFFIIVTDAVFSILLSQFQL